MKLTTTPFLIMLLTMILGCANASQSSKLPPDSVMSGIHDVLPNGWTCSTVSETGKMGHPHGLEEPLFRMDFANPKQTFKRPALQNKTCHPYLRLHFHKAADKNRILQVIEGERMYSWDIPTCFYETTDYVIVTSPAWINHGCYTEEAKGLMVPLERTLKEYFDSQE